AGGVPLRPFCFFFSKSSCPHSLRASTRGFPFRIRVDARNKYGHDGVGRTRDMSDSTTPGGFSASRLTRVTAAMERAIARGEVAGAMVLIERKGQEAYCEARGFQDEEAKVPLKRDTLFRIASMTKPIVSMAALMLVEEGLIRLADPVSKWLPELA